MTDPATETAVAVPEANRLEDYLGYNPDLDFKKLALEAQYFTRGFRLIEDKNALVGVPMVAIGVTYREGFPRDGKAGDYCSVECVVANAQTLNSNPIRHQLPVPPDQLAVFPNECIVFNDSGTGIRRYLTELFHNTGIIDVGTARGDDNPFDKAYQHWKSGADRATTGIVADNDGNAFRLFVGRGLRRSDYQWTPPSGGSPQDATTFYLG